MMEEEFIRTLDLCDSYVTSREAMATALKQCFFSLAEIRYSAGYGKAAPLDTSSSPTLIKVDLLENDEPTFTLQHSMGAKGSTSPQKHSDHGNGKAAPSELQPSEPSSTPGSPDCKDSSAPCRSEPSSGHEQGQSGQYTSLISELAEKYGCGVQDDTLLEEDEGGARKERTFMTPQVRASQEKFKEALQFAIQVINCRSQLLKHLQETQC